MSIAELPALPTPAAWEPDADAILAALTTLPAVCPLPELTDCLGCDPEALSDTLSDLEADGVVSTWEGPDDVLGVILSPLAASRLGIRLDGTSARWIPARCHPHDDDRPRWGLETDCTCAGSDGRAFDLVADPDAVQGLDHLVVAEDAGRVVAGWVPPSPEPEHVPELWKGQPDAASAKVPKPTILVGIGLVGYSPESIAARPCPGCKSIPIASPLAYCLCCDQSGVDHLLFGSLPLDSQEVSAELPVESRPGYVAVTKGESTIEVPERFSRLLKGGESVAVGPATLGRQRR